MSATATELLAQARLVRTFEATLAEGDGRTLDARIVPYNVPAMVIDPPDPQPYSEVFLPGAFERQVIAANRDGRRFSVWMNFEHEPGLRGIVGNSVALDDRSDGLYGSFELHENADGEKALGFVRSGLLTGLSMEFAALRSRRLDGVVQRLRAHVSKVSLCRFPAYDDARVLALRDLPDEIADALLDPSTVIEATEFADAFVAEHAEPNEKVRVEPIDAALAEKLAALGIVPLERISLSTGDWDGSPSRFSDEEYQRSALICRAGDAPPKERCSLPVLEPSGALNVNALGPAAGALAGARGGLADVSRAEKATAARKLIRYYNAAGVEAPRTLRTLAGSA